MKNFPSLLCLTSDNVNFSHAEQVRILIEEGARFIQIRSKILSKSNLIEQINEVAQYVIQNKVILIINDFVDIAKISNLNGVHLGNSDHSVIKSRKILGDRAIIGSTVHNFQEAQTVKFLGQCDYVGLGPFGLSKTKLDLESLLTNEEIQKISKFLFPIPVFLIGGISLAECKIISKFNLAGLAVCSALSSSSEFGCFVKKFINQLPTRDCIIS